jgi:outer membrane protein OmpA-like peptidoglycan-associated protein
MKRLVLIVCLFSIDALLIGQKSLKSQAQLLSEKGNYIEVVKSLEQYKNIEKDIDALLLLAKAYHKTNRQEKAIEKYLIAVNKMPDIIEILFDLGKAYDELSKFDKALQYYKRFLANENNKNSTLYQEAINQIKRIGNARKLKFQPQIAFVENAGIGINTIYDENKIVQSRHVQSRFYFSSNREGSKGGLKDQKGRNDNSGGSANSDIYVFETNNGSIISDEVTSTYNTDGIEIVEEINGEGNAIIYQRNGELIIDTFNIDGNRITSNLNLPYNPKRGDRDLRFYNDSTIVFSSTVYPGYGGYDIFVAKLQPTGLWAKPINLGPNINTVFNEVSPYFTRGGNSLFFSSDRLTSLGGLDIFACVYDGSQWGKEVNLGTPINSTKDDMYAIVTNDGSQLYFSSDRLDALGKNDIYVAYLKEEIKDQLMYNEVLPILANSDFTSMLVSNANQSQLDIIKTEKQKTKTFINPNLYYGDDNEVLSISNQNFIKNIKSIYDIFPELQITIIAHSGIDNDKSLALFFGLKRTELVKEELIKTGVNSANLHQVSYGSSFPGTYEKTRYNSRIEFVLSGVNKEKLVVVNEEINLNNDLKHMNYDTYNQSKTNLVFKVKVAESFQMLRNNDILSMSKLSVHNVESKYEYYTGYTPLYNEIKVMYQDLQAKGFNNLEITPFIGQQKVSKENASNYIDLYPELIPYLGK